MTPPGQAPGPAAPAASPPARATIVLSTLNGAAWLPEQLDSLSAQQGVDWRLLWRDDGSTDDSAAVMQAFTAAQGPERCRRVDPAGHLGVTPSYMTLLRAAVAEGGTQCVAFADQDDVWLPGKLARSLAQLAPHPRPALYCSRQHLVDEALAPLSDSAPIRVRPAFGPALTQNIATGCTVVLNPAAARLVAGSHPPSPSLHDWWSYLVVAASGGSIVADDERTVLYRQHAANAVGAPRSTRRRALAALNRGPGTFMTVFRAQVAALLAQPELLSPDSRRVLDRVAAGLAGNPLRRALALRTGMRRQTWAETALFRCWFMIG